MFDALEKTWGKTDQGNLINELYQGKMKDYVKCLEVSNFTGCVSLYTLVLVPIQSTQLVQFTNISHRGATNVI